MELEGTVVNGVVVPDEPDQLSEGDRVRFVVEEEIARRPVRL